MSSTNGIHKRNPDKMLSQTTNGTSKQNNIVTNGNGHAKDNDDSKSHPVVYTVFISLLLDLLAFTMILPLLPSLLEHYRINDKIGLYSTLSNSVQYFQQIVGAPDKYNSVLFGGMLGSMFSFLQFVASPIVGGLSDCYGRKPIMMICLVMNCLYNNPIIVDRVLIIFEFYSTDWHCMFVWSLGNFIKFRIICTGSIYWWLKQRKYIIKHGHYNRCIEFKKSRKRHGISWNSIFVRFYYWTNDWCNIF